MSRKHRSLRPLSLLPLLMLVTGIAQAHQVWYEGTPGDLTFRYGEMHLNMHEVTPGGMDRFRKLETTWITPQGEKAVTLTKEVDRMDLPKTVHPGAADSLVSVDLEYPMHDIVRDGKSKHNFWVPATRWVGDFSARQPTLTMDIVPTGKGGSEAPEFRVTYLGEPLAGETLTLATPSGWTRIATSDADGRFSFALPWRGDYAINLYFIDEVAGTRKIAGQPDEAYETEGYNTTLSFRVEQGQDPLPATAKTLPASVLLEQGITPPKH
ncbi:nickel uptake transporter family protein [Pseudoxanthomonas yeongjuensis]|jgi:hypothetical protein|uniref:DUF4198 domain-containing protein n=1 Tax=Pseudoxanthomonas yeongjuensis TaxID=377616 RepID=UPI001391DFC4|nr:DUF4198 domain-containing protein [Pseudoxanthomonas yeongjuensis]KAF1716406.1 nickel uptake transporter family protein [Pseudoxanthomonas yeongjuensis]